MADTIKVKAAPGVPEGEVVLWEKDPEHPDGEVFIAADGREHEVAETPAVNDALARRRMVRADRRDAPKDDVPAPARPAR